MSVPQYDLFRVRNNNKDVMWLEAVDGLGAANDRMKGHAQRIPGSYFVFCQRTHAVLAAIDTSISSDTSKRKSA
jgi:hypothetical protein